jgi:hypothetical protein
MANYAGHLVDAPLGPMLQSHEWRVDRLTGMAS